MNKNILEGDQGQEDFQMIIDNAPKNEDDRFFNEAVQALQQIVVNENFQKNQAGFMRKHCEIFQNVEQNKKQYIPLFKQYQQLMSTCLQKMLKQRVPNFDMSRFTSMLPDRVKQIDQQIYEILLSLTDFQVFKQMMLDYKQAHQQQQRLKILTIKSTKAPQHKKIQGATDNIFNSTKPPVLQPDPLATKKKNNTQKKNEKTQQQILVPDLVLTIRPLRKG